MARVWVAMSGGVDSSVAAARMRDAGHEVTGVTMQLLPAGDDEGSCCSTDAVRSAKRVCDLLGIAHYTLNMRDAFAGQVIDPFVAAYASGRTPNPCIVCNDRLKFVELLGRALSSGAEILATGHYARVVCDDSGVPWLARGVDGSKDQSYFLYRMTAEQLAHVRFPCGESEKAEVRAEAEALGLPSAKRPDSQEVCFVTGDPGSFVVARRPEAGLEGSIVDEAGHVIGAHRGIARYTIGQRKGLGLANGPWYVSSIDAAMNRIVVSSGAPAPVLRIVLEDVRWRGVHVTDVDAVVRYRARPVRVRVEHAAEGTLALILSDPVGGVAPGQAVVCYTDGRVVGGGVVRSTS